MPLKFNILNGVWLRILFLFLLGSAITFTVMLGLLHWNLAAFLAFGTTLSFGFLLAPGLVLGGGLALVVISYLITAAWDFFSTRSTKEITSAKRTSVHQKDSLNLPSSLLRVNQNKQPQKQPLFSEEQTRQTHQKRQAEIQSWRQQFIDEFNKKSHEYQQMPAPDLVEALLQLSNEYLNKYTQATPPEIQNLLAAQTLVVYIVESWKNIKVKKEPENQKTDTEEIQEIKNLDLQTKVSPSLPENIRLLLSEKLANWSTTEENADPILAALLKKYISPTEDEKKEKDQQPKAIPNLPNTSRNNNLTNASSLREQYSPAQQIDLVFHTPAETKFVPEVEIKREVEKTLPEELMHWVKGLSLTHQVDQHQQQQHVIAQEAKMDFSLDVKMQAGLQVDASHHFSYEQAQAQLRQAQKGSTPRWLEVIKEKIFSTQGIEPSTPFSISPKALEVLIRGNDYCCNPRLIDLEKLATGISLVRDKQGGISLIYQETDSKTEQKTDHLLMDYAHDITESNYERDRALYKQEPKEFKKEFLRELKLKSRVLDHQEKKFIDSLETPDYKMIDKDSKVYILYILRSVNHHLSVTDVAATIAALKECQARTFIGSSGKHRNLLAVVSSSFYKAKFDNPKAIQALVSLAQCSDVELRWFDELTAYYPTVFEDVAKGFFYFINFFKTQGIPLTDKTKIIKKKFRESSFGILTKALDLISLAKSKKLQSEFITELPYELMLAKAQLRAGYTVVHRGMYFETSAPCGGTEFQDFFKDLPDPCMISPGDLKPMNYNHSEEGAPMFYRALFLRYAALHGDSDDFVTALAKWRKYTGEDLYSCLSEMEEGWDAMDPHQAGAARSSYLKSLNAKLKTHWPTLKKYLLSLNKGLSVKDHKQSSDESDNPIWLKDGPQDSTNKQYDLTQAETLLTKLGINQTEREALIKDLKFLNDSTKLPTSDDKFRQAITQAKTKLKESKDKKDTPLSTTEDSHHDTLLRCLALMREAHYRLTQPESSDDEKDEKSTQPEEGQWLRLEQAVVILLALRKDTLFQIDTSEGKTLILQWLALLKALPGQKGNVLTHNETLAEESVDSLKPLASLFGIKVAKKTDTPETILQADILYIDVATAVINEKLAQFAEEKDEKQDEDEEKEQKDIPKLPGTRKAGFALVDEVENVAIDIHAGTSMQISESSGEADPELEAFLTTLNTLIRTTLPEKIKTQADEFKSKEAQRAFIQTELNEGKSQAYYQKYCQDPEHIRLDFWISAAATAVKQKEKEDYVIDPITIDREKKEKYEVVRILHKETTGRVDKVSQWGAGVHQCVAAWEKVHNHSLIKIPAPSQVIAEGDVAHHLQTQYTSRCGFTGTLGESAVQTTMQAILQTEATVIMPRANKTPPEEAAWPQVPTLETRQRLQQQDQVIEETIKQATTVKEIELTAEAVEKARIKALQEEMKKYKDQKLLSTEPRYNRRYDFPPHVYKTRQAHLTALLAAVRSVQAQNLSVMLFFNTVKECEEFANFLTLNGIDANTLQILDDTHPEPGETGENKLRPSEATVITQAKIKKQITLTTAAGSRGTDFKGIDVGIVTKPSLWRVLLQKLGRLGRNKDFGITYEIYCEQDLGGDPFQQFLPKNQEETQSQTSVSDTKEEKTKLSSSQPQNRFRFFMQPYEESKQARDLANIHTRAPLRAFKQGLQADFVAHRRTAKDKKQLNAAWANFFGQIDLHWQTNQTDSSKIEALCQQCFTNTSWDTGSITAVQTQFKASISFTHSKL